VRSERRSLVCTGADVSGRRDELEVPASERVDEQRVVAPRALRVLDPKLGDGSVR